VGWHYVALLLTMLNTMTVVWNLVAITTGTSLMLALSHLLFFLFIPVHLLVL
jgi:hypothetical protein